MRRGRSTAPVSFPTCTPSASPLWVEPRCGVPLVGDGWTHSTVSASLETSGAASSHPRRAHGTRPAKTSDRRASSSTCRIYLSVETKGNHVAQSRRGGGRHLRRPDRSLNGFNQHRWSLMLLHAIRIHVTIMVARHHPHGWAIGTATRRGRSRRIPRSFGFQPDIPGSR